ncbi:MAG: response regulator transcription factor [Saprospiraceae bacterium]|nr:response regulator transcription factor [Saprospiraceae bacterium]
MYKILLVDDDRMLSPLVKEYLEAKDYTCTLCYNAHDGLKEFNKKEFDLCILDIVMPLEDGYELAAKITNINPNIPFLFLSGKTQQEDKIKGLEAGADDYILKPFSMKELYLRIQAILKRSKSQGSSKTPSIEYQISSYSFNPSARELKRDEDTLNLSWIESQLLHMFCQAPDGIISRDIALKQIWSDEHNFKSRSLNVYVSKLRNYLQADPSIRIRNIHGSGYQMVIK